MTQDLRLAFRLMVRQPLMATTAIVALTVGIGLANVGFATMEAMLFSKLPFDEGGRFVRFSVVDQLKREPVTLTAEGYGRLSTMPDTLEHVGAVKGGRESIELPSGGHEETAIASVTPSSLPYFKAVPIQGRLLTTDDAEPGRPPVALIGEAFWRRLMSAADSVIGTTIKVGNVTRTIVGVLPASFKVPNSPSIWMPLDEGFRSGRSLPDPNARLFGVMAPGVTLEALSGRLDVIAPHVAMGLVSPERPRDSGTPGPRVDVTSFTDLGDMAPILSATIVIVMLTVLIVIAANVGNLVLARSLSRVREFALRAALGASRSRLVGQVMAEVLLLGCIAAVLGSLGARAVLREFNAMDDIPFWVDFTGGTFTLFAVAGAALVATAIAGAWPAIRATRRNLLAGLQSSDGRSSDVRFGRVAGVMVVAQIAVSVVMLHGALVVGQAFRNYTHVALDLPRK